MKTIKEEKKADLGQLLNSLIERGFRPFGRYDKLMGSGRFGSRQFVKFGIFPEEEFTLRELTSINSGLWQFVCENGMVKEDDGHIARIINLYKSDEAIVDGGWNYHYWLMICSILDESELEDFLLNSISLQE